MTKRCWSVMMKDDVGAAHAAQRSKCAFTRGRALSRQRGLPSYPVPSSLPSSPPPLMPAKITRIAAETIAPSNIGRRVR